MPIGGLSPSCSAVSIESPWQAPSNCRISHLPVLESSGNRDSVPDIPLEQFTSSCASSWPLDEPTISWTWWGFLLAIVCSGDVWEQMWMLTPKASCQCWCWLSQQPHVSTSSATSQSTPYPPHSSLWQLKSWVSRASDMLGYLHCVRLHAGHFALFSHHDSYWPPLRQMKEKLSSHRWKGLRA